MHRRRPTRGFSLLELVIVLGISLAVAAMAVPKMINAADNFKLRSAASSVSGLVQKCRMKSVAGNSFYSMMSASSGGLNYAFIGNPGDTGRTTALNTASSDLIQLPARMIFDNFGSHPSDASINGGLTVTPDLPIFNPRGLPCFIPPTGGPCSVSPTNIYIAYIRQDRSLGGTGWAAITVTAAGRLRVYTWDGNNWE